MREENGPSAIYAYAIIMLFCLYIIIGFDLAEGQDKSV